MLEEWTEAIKDLEQAQKEVKAAEAAVEEAKSKLDSAEVDKLAAERRLKELGPDEYRRHHDLPPADKLELVRKRLAHLHCMCGEGLPRGLSTSAYKMVWDILLGCGIMPPLLTERIRERTRARELPKDERSEDGKRIISRIYIADGERIDPHMPFHMWKEVMLARCERPELFITEIIAPYLGVEIKD